MAAKKKKRSKKTGKKARKKVAKRRKSSVAKHHRAHRKAGTGYASKLQEFLKADDIVKRSKRKGKRWTCGGPVRSGCGGSNSKVVR